MRKKLLKTCLFLLIFFGVERFCYSQTGGFRLPKITSQFPPDPAWETNCPVPAELFRQKYSFLGKGVQCYAFESEDKTTVLKLFKHYHAGVSNTTLKKIPLPSILDRFREKILQARYERVNEIYTSSKIAFEELKEETGLLYLHLNPTSHLKRQLLVVDLLGISHQIDLDTTPFLLQKKGAVAFEQLSVFLQKGELNKVKAAINSLINLIVARCQKGIANTDPILRRNIGYFDTQAFEIDTGSFIKDPYLKKPHLIKRELFFETLELKEWIENHCPVLTSFFQEKINALLDQPFT